MLFGLALLYLGLGQRRRVAETVWTQLSRSNQFFEHFSHRLEANGGSAALEGRLLFFVPPGPLL